MAEAMRNTEPYRQEAKRLRDAGFVECRSFTALPFDDQLDRFRIVESRIGHGGKTLWVRIVEKEHGT